MERVVRGSVPAKHHIAFRDDSGDLRWEECFTRDGFDGPYSILYHQHRPHEQRIVDVDHGWAPPVAAEVRALAKRHYRSQALAPVDGAPVDAHVPLLFNRDVTISMVLPSEPDPVYVVNADGDDLYWVFEGGGRLITPFGTLRFTAGDYVRIPKGCLHRFEPDDGPQRWLHFECAGAVKLLEQWRNAVGQLTMDAPYCHRDFRKPAFDGPTDEGIREQIVKRKGLWTGFALRHSPLDVVGWDGAEYPWVFPILNFQPRAGLVHLPPTWHGTFAIRGALVCSFVPRVVDFHEDAIPCPYPHSSVDVDEFLFYAEGNFTSRKGVEPGSISHHPAGLPHGPHPGAYENSIGHRETNELAVMLDCFEPLVPTPQALGIEDPAYHDSFIED
jgi:homogentisate 1,2-dioxygenase